jgi:hypothetical protein
MGEPVCKDPQRDHKREEKFSERLRGVAADAPRYSQSGENALRHLNGYKKRH